MLELYGKALGWKADEEDMDKIICRIYSQDKHEDQESYVTYRVTRLFCNYLRDFSDEERIKIFRKHAEVTKKIPQLFNYIKGAIEEFNSKKYELIDNETTGRMEFSTDMESNGIGFHINLVAGEHYQSKFGIEPLVVRDSPITLTLEFGLKK